MPKMNRRDMLKLSGLAAGSLAVGSALPGCSSNSAQAASDPTQQNSLLASLPTYVPGSETLGADEMRISFMGTTCIPMISQAAVSVFVETGNGDSFCFDFGTGSIVKYWAMGVNMDRLSKLFLAHLHADHMGDVAFLYGFGPSYGRLWPLYLWGPQDSGFVWVSPDGNPAHNRGPYPDGIAAYCAALKNTMVWHNESQSFLGTSYSGYTPPAYDPAGHRDAYDLVPFELDWRKTGRDAQGNILIPPDNVAYNDGTVKITHFPAVHCREGSVSYKLEYNGMSMIYAGDTKPNYYMIDQATSGVDVLIHEIVMPATNWVAKMGMDPNNPVYVDAAQNVQDSSHTPQKAYGYILSQLQTPPKLAVATHFQATDDDIKSALSDIRKWYTGPVTIASDTMVINVKKGKTPVVRRAVVSNYAWPVTKLNPSLGNPGQPNYWKYVDATKTATTGDAFA